MCVCVCVCVCVMNKVIDTETLVKNIFILFTLCEVLTVALDGGLSRESE